ncbi:acyl-CoA dehydrogenase family protein [Rhodococcus koreensis]|uniref:Acyl-CoA dehydrogenase n=1 Tax=Rhodococcus koreensis TaxID=99653 RepID=A0A1H4Y8E5_9NOCA|nr:acyl-CoA dehydrogenase family protein [Rhodococcus koreensis]QSE79945.1 acyl-CoA dehydrogenase family protein [Rhodococcus koreensis]SED13550.1 Acyl-CoA dehydrogenase [Rhodococcus koreensis]
MTVITEQKIWSDAPATADGWIARAREVSAILARDAVERDRAGGAPFDEVRLLKDSGLVTLLGPTEFGGAGQPWETAYQVVREIARGDGSLGQLLGYHYLWAWAVRLVGTAPQIGAVEELYTSNRFLFGGAVNPRDTDLTIVDRGDTLVYNGEKSFSTGGRATDLTVLEGIIEGTATHVFAIVPTAQDGIVFRGDWDNLGQRLTDSGTVEINDVEVDWSGAAGFVDKEFQPLVYNTLNFPALEIVFANFYVGIARGALDTAADYTRTRTRPWPYGGDDKELATDEWYLREGYGDLQSKLWAAEAFVDQVNREANAVLHDARENLTEQARGDLAVRIAAAKIRAADVALEIGTKVFELTGARATSNTVGLDIFWRNVRTHTLHDPVAYKRREVGGHLLTGELPEPTWYT